MKNLIERIYTWYLFKKGATIEELYEKTKKFHNVPKAKGYWKKSEGKWKYYGEDGMIY